MTAEYNELNVLAKEAKARHFTIGYTWRSGV